LPAKDLVDSFLGSHRDTEFKIQNKFKSDWKKWNSEDDAGVQEECVCLSFLPWLKMLK